MSVEFAAWKWGIPATLKAWATAFWKMRIDYGPGYRMYYTHHGEQIVMLLCGGDKRTQQQDIKRAQKLAEAL